MSSVVKQPSGREGLQEQPWEGGDLLVSYLEQIGVEYVFGVPGGAIEPLYNALARSARHGGPKAVVARHESGGAYMAEGYARQTGRLGVCCTTTGPGATNVITAVSCAYENHVPLLVITGQTALSTFGKGAFQESSCTGVNTVGMFTYCTRYNSLVSHPSQLEQKLIAAVMTAYHAPSGPSHLSIPIDVLRKSAPVSNPTYDLPSLLARRAPIDHRAVDHLEARIRSARRVVFVLGDDCHEAAGAILDLAMQLDANVVTTPHGKGLINPWHPLFKGVVGFAGHETANQILLSKEVDLVVAVGTSLGEWASNGWDSRTVMTSRLVHVEEIAANLTHSPMAGLHVAGSPRKIFENLRARFQTAEGQARKQVLLQRARDNLAEERLAFRLENEAAYVSDATPITPQRLMHELALRLPPTAKYYADTGNSMIWTTHYLHPRDRRVGGQRREEGGVFRACMEFAPMGWSIGAAVGAAFGYRKGPVVCITGDGSMLMSGQELTVAVEHGLNVIFVILNDAALGMVKHGQRLGGAEPVGCDLPQVDFCAVAEAMGATGYRIRSPEDLAKLDFATRSKKAGPAVLDVYVDGEQVPPLGMRVRVLKGMTDG